MARRRVRHLPGKDRVHELLADVAEACRVHVATVQHLLLHRAQRVVRAGRDHRQRIELQRVRSGVLHLASRLPHCLDRGAGISKFDMIYGANAAGIPIADAIYLANKAAGIVVGKIGTSPILFKELQDELQIGKPASKLIPISQLADTIKQLRAQERKIIFTNGCFDILHKGHVCYLEKAKRLGDVLIVGLNSDSSVKRLKGESRPINDESARSTVLAALEAVDYVVIFTEDTPLNLIKTVAPDVLVKGGDYAIENIVGREYAQETVTIPFVDGYSTTKTIGAINQEKQ